MKKNFCFIIAGGLWVAWVATVHSQSYTFTTVAGAPSSAGSADGTNSNARFYNPGGVAVDSAGVIYVADNSNHTIRKITPGGTNWVVTTLAGMAGYSGSADGTGREARFNQPYGIAVDGFGDLYVADTLNHTIRKVTPEGVVSTLAGLPGTSGSDDGMGSDARFNSPTGVAVDSSGNVYIADYWNHTIREITPSGAVSTFAGLAGVPGSDDATGNLARFNTPSGVAVDSVGNVYVADYRNNTIRKITPAGTVTTLAGTAGTWGPTDGTGGNARFNNPFAVAVDSLSNVYVADLWNFTIRKITPARVVSTFAGQAGTQGSADGTGSSARFSNPIGVAVDASNNVYVADYNNNTIQRITPARVVTTLAGSASGGSGSVDGTGRNARFNHPNGVAVDGGNNIYVADTDNQTIRKITPAGVVSTLSGLAGASGSADGTGSNARFNNPYHVAADSAGNIYVSDHQNHTVRKITPARAVSTLAGMAGVSGSTDGTGSNARFNYPVGVAVDSLGNVYVADYQSHTLRMVTPDGDVSTLAGLAGVNGSADGTGSEARFALPWGVALDTTGNLYVADCGNHTIRKIKPVGADWEVSTLAGLAGVNGTADGTNSDARFYFPEGVAVDSAGNLYVADFQNHTIRKITAVGADWVVSTVAGLAGVSGSTDGTGGNARFTNPDGVAVDSAGNIYVADYGNHTIRKGVPLLPPPPALQLCISASQLILSWPLTASGFVLETSTSLDAGASWQPLTGGLATAGSNYVMTNAMDAATAFYRLRKP